MTISNDSNVSPVNRDGYRIPRLSSRSRVEVAIGAIEGLESMTPRTVEFEATRRELA